MCEERLETRWQSRVSSPPHMKTLKSQLTAEQASEKKTGIYQKRYCTFKEKDEATTRWSEGIFTIYSNLTPTK